MAQQNPESVGTDAPLAQLVLDELLRGITTGEYRSGERVVASNLCEKLGLSLAPVREALHVLSGQGIVELHRNRGAILRRMSKQDVIDFCPVVSAAIEISIDMATKRMYLEENRDLVAAEMEKVIANTQLATGFEFYLSTNSYHYTLIDIAANPFIETLVNRDLIAYWEFFLAQNLNMPDYAVNYIRSYQRLTDSILTGDSQSARSIWQYHVEWVIAILNGEYIEPGTPWIR